MNPENQVRNEDWRTPLQTRMPTSARSDVKFIAGTTASGSRQVSALRRGSATFNAIYQGSPEDGATNRVGNRCRTERLSLHAAILCIAVLSAIVWAAIVALAAVFL
jgi:hypothetical protein